MSDKTERTFGCDCYYPCEDHPHCGGYKIKFIGRPIKPERTKEEILKDITFVVVDVHGETHNIIYPEDALKAMEEYRQSSPVESPDEFAMKFLEYASGLAVSNYKSGGSWYLSDGRIVKTADILKQFKSELEEPKEK